MIPVPPQNEPDDFDAKVRKRGRKWLARQRIPLNTPPPDPAKLPPYWQACQKQLWKAYRGVCAYLSIRFEWPSGTSTTDHFAAKSRAAGLAYEWSNYRLSCLGMNRNKNRFDDLLDPFEIDHETFVLNLASGEISPNRALHPLLMAKAETTIQRLKLDDPETNLMRAGHYSDYLNEEVSDAYLARTSPFVWHEARRQGLL
jgi:uncharacterized protein (TIGR02646 family)